MMLDDRIVPYLQMAGLYYLARLNESWFRLNEPLVSAFVERWRPETHDVAYHIGLPIDGQYVSGCLTDFPQYIEGGRPPWVWFDELLGVLPHVNCIDKFTVKCTWFEEMFSELPQGANEETIRRYARAYMMMLLSMQLFGDKLGTRLHIRWLPYIARLEDIGQYSWGSTALSWLYRCMCRVANKNAVKLAGPLQLLQSWIFWRFPGFQPDGYDVFHWPLASR
ncbi:hypothetical protein Ahy_B06g081307 isoform B [Arachis hypogaea]|uniref:Aminotransferase-like plant mobile domain-containing protein n=1 Tax=Arachis hypogaea TaxID=3818 RepID=A0A444YKM5_ARAHY|nr:hypothetical protein Ahy_B06g081307 isoform B [Arachis hypogaea]